MRVWFSSELGYFRAKASPEESAKLVNDWVEAATKGKITDLFGEMSQNLTLSCFQVLGQILEEIEKNTSLVLVNAVHFKDSWKEQFTLQSEEMKFQKSEGKIVTINLITSDHDHNLNKLSQG